MQVMLDGRKYQVAVPAGLCSGSTFHVTIEVAPNIMTMSSDIGCPTAPATGGSQMVAPTTTQTARDYVRATTTKVLFKPSQNTSCGVTLGTKTHSAVVVNALEPDGLAAASGLTVSDEVLSINGESVTSHLHAVALIRSTQGEVRITVAGSEAPTPATGGSQMVAPTTTQTARDYVRATTTKVLFKPSQNTSCGVTLGTKTHSAVVVNALEPDGLAAASGLTVSDEVLSINGESVTSHLHAVALLRSTQGEVRITVAGSAEPGPSSSPPGARVTCGQCGNPRTSDDENFCTGCGAPFDGDGEDAALAATISASPVDAAPLHPMEADPAPAAAPDVVPDATRTEEGCATAAFDAAGVGAEVPEEAARAPAATTLEPAVPVAPGTAPEASSDATSDETDTALASGEAAATGPPPAAFQSAAELPDEPPAAELPDEPPTPRRLSLALGQTVSSGADLGTVAPPREGGFAPAEMWQWARQRIALVPAALTGQPLVATSAPTHPALAADPAVLAAELAAPAAPPAAPPAASPAAAPAVCAATDSTDLAIPAPEATTDVVADPRDTALQWLSGKEDALGEEHLAAASSPDGKQSEPEPKVTTAEEPADVGKPAAEWTVPGLRDVSNLWNKVRLNVVQLAASQAVQSGEGEGAAAPHGLQPKPATTESDAATVDMASDVEVPAAEPNRLLRSPDVPAVSSEPAPARPVPKDVQETFRRDCRYQK